MIKKKKKGKKMKGLVTEYSFLMWYSIFALLVVYLTGLAGYSVVSGTPNAPTSVTTPSLLNVLAPFQTFIALMTLGTEYQLLAVGIFSPFAIVLLYIIIKALPFT